MIRVGAHPRIGALHDERKIDYVSVHTPNTPITHHIVNAETLAMMKPTAPTYTDTKKPDTQPADMFAY